MSREINVEEAPDWDAEETANNLRYLAQLNRTNDIARVHELRGEETPEDKDTQSVPDPDGGLPDDAPDFAEASIDTVLEWVGEDKQRAMQALEEENTFDKPRKGILEPLEALVTAPDE